MSGCGCGEFPDDSVPCPRSSGKPACSPLPDAPYGESSATGSSWPWGRPGDLPAIDYPAGHQGGGAGMLDRMLDEDYAAIREHQARPIPWLDDPYPFEVEGRLTFLDRPPRGRFVLTDPVPGRCPIPECTIPSTSDTDPCEAHQ